MIDIMKYSSPIGNILLASKNQQLIGLWLEGQKYYLSNIKEEMKENENVKVLQQTKLWLDRYFRGDKPDLNELDVNPSGSAFRKKVWKILCDIPYGEVVTYQDIASKLETNGKRMSAQAVGGAVSHNPISIIIPCHRVVGTNGSLTGYAGGIEKKLYLLEHEKVDMTHLSPAKGEHSYHE